MNDGVLAVAKNDFLDDHQAAAPIRLAEKGLGRVKGTSVDGLQVRSYQPSGDRKVHYCYVYGQEFVQSYLMADESVAVPKPGSRVEGGQRDFIPPVAGLSRNLAP